ncbi:MAG: pyrrolo-quinoline quinone [Candidatus Sulfotelmatobacter sp.]|nr:pyrrolo-quinoline quinone [Candidatus Sulfotelmatobacter sp.]
MCALLRRYAEVCLITIAAIFVGCVLVSETAAQSFSGVLTYHNDIGRTGQNLNETILTPQNVNVSNFGKLFAYPVDGAIFAQPLYVPNVAIPGQGVHNVVYIVTEQDGVYAFDADGKSNLPLWYVSLINPAQGITAVPCADMAQSCNVYPVDGITGTPVINMSSDTIYFVAQTLENGVYYQRLHAIDITTGAQKFGGPTVIQGSVKNSRGTLTFDPGHNLPRPGLLLLNNVVYLAWAGDTHGWMMSYDATTLQQLGIISTTPNGNLGGLWASGGGILSDGTYIYVETGDGTFDLNNGGKDFADSLVKLDPNTLQVLDYFTPMDQGCRRLNDMDLGSGGPMLIPSQSGPGEIVVSGKGGNPCDSFGTPPVWASLIYLVDKDNMGHYNALGPDLDIQTIEGAAYGYHSSPAYWHGVSGSYIYMAGLTSEGGSGDFLKQYTLSNGLLSTTPTAQTATNFVIGATPSISANGTTNGIVWAQERSNILSSISNIQPAILFAFDANNVATTFYSSNQMGNRDQAGSATKFELPTIANGKVYLATLFELDVYGLLGGQSATTTALTASANPVYGSPVTLKTTVSSTTGTPTGSVNFYQKDGYNLVGVGTLVNKQTSVQVSGLSVGNHTFNASYDGTGAFAVSSGTVSFAVNKAPTSSVINSSSLNPSTYGQPVTFTATVTSSAGAGTPTGTVTFEQAPGTLLGTGTLTAGVATFTTTATQLNGGTDKILVIYNPDQNHAKSTSPTFTQTVNPQATSTAFTSSPNPSTVGQSVTLTATVTAAVGTPTGNVIFRANGAVLGTVALVNGKATLNYAFPAKGSITVKAAYQGSANNALSTNSLTQVVN